MGNEVEKAGIALVVMANLISIAKTVGSNKIVPTISIPYPLGMPLASKEEEREMRYSRVGIALDALTTEITEATVFEVKK